MSKVGRPKIQKHEKVEEYIAVFPKKKGHIYSSLKIYCQWRNITIDEFLANGKKELKHFKRYMNESRDGSVRSPKLLTVEEESVIAKEYANRRGKISCISQFLRWFGVEIPKYDRTKGKKTYFTNPEDEEIFEDYLESFSGDSASTIQAAKRCLKKYMDYRLMTLEEIKVEGNTKQPDEIKRILRKYRDAMRETGVKFYFKSYVSHVLRFYEAICYKRFQIKDKKNGNDNGEEDHESRNTTIINKEIISQLLKGADERDQMIIYTLLDTGLSPQDVCNITYGKLKNHLNLNNPNTITKSIGVIYRRQKTKKLYIAMFGWQSLRSISKWMRIRRDGLLGNAPQELKDDTSIFSQKRFPFQQVTPHQLTRVIRVRSELCGFKKPKHFTPAHFRNTFSNKLKPLFASEKRHPDDFKLIFGHHTGVSKHYENLRDAVLPRVLPIYEEFYGLFNLERPDEKYESLEKEHEKLRLENQDLRVELKDIKLVVDKLSEAFASSVREQTLMRDQQKEVEMYFEWKKEKEEIAKKMKPIDEKRHEERQRIIREHGLKLITPKTKKENVKEVTIEGQSFLVVKEEEEEENNRGDNT